MLEDSRCNRMIGMRGQPGIAHVAHHLVRGQIFSQRAGAIEVRLHAGIERGQSAFQHPGLIGGQIECRQTATLEQRMRAFGGGVHAVAFKL